jgi:glucan 1,3-beta-glucosidase
MTSPFDGVYQPYQTGDGNGIIDAADVAQYGVWPPASIGLEADAALLPTYTPTGPVPTLPPATFPSPTPTTPSGGDGWYDKADTSSGMITVSGCSYPNAWDATAVAVPPVCTG